MGMTDKQFSVFVKFLREAIKEAIEESDEVKRKEKLEKMLSNLQTTED